MATHVEVEKLRDVRANSGKPAEADGVEIAFRSDVTDLPHTVRFHFFSEDAVVCVKIAPERLEQAAALMKEIRRETGDYRYVCASHGYHEEYDCAGCEAEKAKAATTNAAAEV